MDFLDNFFLFLIGVLISSVFWVLFICNAYTNNNRYTYIDVDNNVGSSSRCITEFNIKACELENGSYISVLDYKK